MLRLNRPERLNAINEVMQSELKQAFESLGSDTTVSAVVLTGEGRGFCSGIDVRDFGPGMLEGDGSGHRPAAVSGVDGGTAAGDLGLAAACDCGRQRPVCRCRIGVVSGR